MPLTETRGLLFQFCAVNEACKSPSETKSKGNSSSGKGLAEGAGAPGAFVYPVGVFSLSGLEG